MKDGPITTKSYNKVDLLRVWTWGRVNMSSRLPIEGTHRISILLPHGEYLAYLHERRGRPDNARERI